MFYYNSYTRWTKYNNGKSDILKFIDISSNWSVIINFKLWKQKQ